jgi:hypothetical protein
MTTFAQQTLSFTKKKLLNSGTENEREREREKTLFPLGMAAFMLNFVLK